jgi:hypothetical protein
MLVVSGKSLTISFLAQTEAVLGTRWTGVLCLVGGLLTIPLTVTRKEVRGARLVALLPQQILVALGAVGGVLSIVNGHYPDGNMATTYVLIGAEITWLFLFVAYTGAVADLIGDNRGHASSGK